MTILSHIKNIVGTTDLGPSARVVVVGDSHSAALLRAQRYPKRAEQYGHVHVYRLRKVKDGKSVGDVALSKFLREIRSFGTDDFVFSTVGGNQYAIPSTVRSEIEYDFLLSDTDRLSADGRQLVPFRALAGFIESGIRESIMPVLRGVTQATTAKVYHLVPPPPKEDNQFIAAHVDGYFKREGLGSLGPSDPSLRLKCWKVQLKILETVCRELNISLVMPPTRTVTPSGFLQPNCYATDATHANRRYGEAVLKQILELVRTESRERQ